MELFIINIHNYNNNNLNTMVLRAKLKYLRTFLLICGFLWYNIYEHFAKGKI